MTVYGISVRIDGTEVYSWTTNETVLKSYTFPAKNDYEVSKTFTLTSIEKYWNGSHRTQDGSPFTAVVNNGWAGQANSGHPNTLSFASGAYSAGATVSFQGYWDDYWVYYFTKTVTLSTVTHEFYNGTTLQTSNTYTYNQTVPNTKNSNAGVSNGYNHYWSCDSNNVTLYSKTSHVTYKLLWTRGSALTYIIYYYKNHSPTDTNKEHSDQTISHNTAWNVLGNAVRTGYTFNGWFTERTGGTRRTTGNTAYYTDNLFAQWTLSTYTITYDKNHSDTGVGVDDAPGVQTITHGVPWIAKPPIERQGYNFNGWFTERTGGVERTNDTDSIAVNEVYETDTLYAQWSQIITTTFQFNVNGGNTFTPANNVKTYTGSNDVIVQYNTFGTPTRNRYVFSGWATVTTASQTSTTVDNPQSKTIFNNASSRTTISTIYMCAVWIPIKMNIYTVKSGVVESITQSININTSTGKFTEPTIPVVLGYKFENWYTTTSLQTVLSFNTVYEGRVDINAYAVYERVMVLFNENTWTLGVIQKEKSEYMLDDVTFFTSGTITTTTGIEDIVVAQWDSRINGIKSYEWFGFLKLKSSLDSGYSGYYKFYTRSDDCSYMWIGNYALQGYTTYNAHAKSPGTHAVRYSPEPTEDFQISHNEYIPIRIQFGGNTGLNEFKEIQYKFKSTTAGTYSNYVDISTIFEVFTNSQNYEIRYLKNTTADVGEIDGTVPEFTKDGFNLYWTRTSEPDIANAVTTVDSGYQTTTTQPDNILYSYYANWERAEVEYTYKICPEDETHVVGDKIRPTITVIIGNYLDFSIELFTRTGYNQIGWKIGNDIYLLDSVLDTAHTVLDTNQDVCAVWEIIDYTIQYQEGTPLANESAITDGPSDSTSFNIETTQPIVLDTSKYTQKNQEQIGWRIDYDDDGTLDSYFVEFPNNAFPFYPYNVTAVAIWESKQYKITYRFSDDISDFHPNFYVPGTQTYTFSELTNGNLKLKKLYVEYKGFYTDGWSMKYVSDDPVTNPGDFYQPDSGFGDERTGRIPSTVLYPIWKKIEYKLINNTYNYKSIYSRKTIQNNYFYPYTRRLNHSIQFEDSLNPDITLTYETTGGLVLSDSHILKYMFDNNMITLLDAYNFFFYGETQPDRKSLRLLQETYEKKSLEDLKNVLVLKHYPSYNSISASVPMMTIGDEISEFYYHYQFNVNGTFDTDVDIMCEILLVGCGGLGGAGGVIDGVAGGGGGGGGGEVVHIPLYVMRKGSYTITVGESGSDIDTEIVDNTPLETVTIFKAKHGGNGGNFNNNGISGGSGGGAGGSTDNNKKLGGNEGVDSVDSLGMISYKNKAGFSKTLNGSGGGGAGTYSDNVVEGEGTSIGGDGIRINIRNDNAVWGRGGYGGSSESVSVVDTENTGNGGNGGYGDTVVASYGSSGVVIIKVKDGYEVDHQSPDTNMMVKGLLMRNIVAETSGSLKIVQTIETKVSDSTQVFEYWGFLKSPFTDTFEFKIETNATVVKFTLGFTSLPGDIDVTNQLKLDIYNLDGQINLKQDIYYPLYLKYDDYTQNLNFSLTFRRLQIGDFQDPSNFFYHLNNFPGTTSMTETKAIL